MTFGVDAVVTSREVSQSAAGVASLAVVDLGLDEGLEACGGHESLMAEIDAIAWTRKNGETDATLEASFELSEDRAELQVSADAETLSLQAIRLLAPSTTALEVELRKGTAHFCDFEAGLEISASEVSLENVAGTVSSYAETTALTTSALIDLEASGALGAIIESGTLSAGGEAQVQLQAGESGLGEVTISSGGQMQLGIPSGHSFTLEISTLGYAAVAAGDVSYASDQEGAESPEAGLTFEIRGGGPRIVVSGAQIIVGEI
jgi:hypothetical protein